jgi:NAD+ synthase (glutamine-hydrolysing)
MNTFRITLAQLNPTIGDFAGNIALMRDAAATAFRDQAQMVVFSELSLTGYSPGDLLDEPAFIDRAEQGVVQ